MSDNVCTGLGTAVGVAARAWYGRSHTTAPAVRAAAAKRESGDTRGSGAGQHRDEARADGAGDAVRSDVPPLSAPLLAHLAACDGGQTAADAAGEERADQT